MTKYTKSSLPTLLAVSLACTLLSACGTDDKPRIIVDNTDVPDKGGNGNDNGNGDDNTGNDALVVPILALANEVSYPKYEDGTHAVSQYGTYSCFTWQEKGEPDFDEKIENGIKRCGLIQYTITGDFSKLSKVSPDKPITVDYKLVSAVGNVSDILQDPDLGTGTITLHKNNIQQNLNFILKTDNKKTGDWDIKLKLSNPTNGANLDNLNTAILATKVIDVQSLDNNNGNNPDLGAINDTGVAFSADLIKGNETTCTAGVNGKQDCANGRDKLANDNTDGIAGFSFTKLDSAGKPLVATAKDWDCVKDNVTGMIWERKTFTPEIDGKYGAEGNANKDYRDSSWDYTFYDASVGLGNAGNEYSNTKCKLGDGIVCNTANYIAKMNSDTVCGISNWRLPTRIELIDLANMGGHHGYQTMHVDWLFTKNDANDDREWLNYKLPNQFWTSSVAASYNTHDGYSSPASLKFNNIWAMFNDGSLTRQDPSSAYSTAGILAVAPAK